MNPHNRHPLSFFLFWLSPPILNFPDEALIRRNQLVSVVVSGYKWLGNNRWVYGADVVMHITNKFKQIECGHSLAFGILDHPDVGG